MSGKMITVSARKVKDYVSNSGDTIQRASNFIGASHDYLGNAMRNSKRGMIEISEKYFKAFCKIYEADPEDLKTRPYTHKKNSDDYKKDDPIRGDEVEQLELFESERPELPEENLDEVPDESSFKSDSIEHLVYQANLCLSMALLMLKGG